MRLTGDRDFDPIFFLDRFFAIRNDMPVVRRWEMIVDEVGVMFDWFKNEL